MRWKSETDVKTAVSQSMDSDKFGVFALWRNMDNGRRVRHVFIIVLDMYAIVPYNTCSKLKLKVSQALAGAFHRRPKVARDPRHRCNWDHPDLTLPPARVSTYVE